MEREKHWSCLGRDSNPKQAAQLAGVNPRKCVTAEPGKQVNSHLVHGHYTFSIVRNLVQWHEMLQLPLCSFL